jgi:A/G-specific adenine glycosylase
LISPQDVRSFRRSLLRWYRRNGRDLPWRRIRDPYAILVSEFMLQQTQVATVLPYYNEWLRRFPDFSSLALAPESSVLHGWQGLGYYTRARNLHALAKIVFRKHGGVLPDKIDNLRALPGVGRYTANAVATFAFDRSVPLVEANIARVMARLFDVREPIDSTRGREAIWDCAVDLLPARGAASYNSALMDLGALVCTATSPKCGICPVNKFCRAQNPEALPIKKPRPLSKELTEAHTFTFHRNRLLLEKSSGRWRGLWILPRARSASSARLVHMSVFPFTNHRITLKIFAHPPPRLRTKAQRWFSTAQLASIPLPSPHRRAVEQLLARRPQKLCSTFAPA